MSKFIATVRIEIEHDNGDYTSWQRQHVQHYSAEPGQIFDLTYAVIHQATHEVRKAVAEDFPPVDWQGR